MLSQERFDTMIQSASLMVRVQLFTSPLVGLKFNFIFIQECKLSPNKVIYDSILRSSWCTCHWEGGLGHYPRSSPHIGASYMQSYISTSRHLASWYGNIVHINGIYQYIIQLNVICLDFSEFMFFPIYYTLHPNYILS